MVSPPPASSTLATTTKTSTDEWRNDLQKLFEHARERFPDVVWELGDDPDQVEEVWGHKAIVYARAPPSFQARYFKFRPAPSAAPNPYGASPLPNGQSTYSLSLPLEDLTPGSRSPSPFATRRAMSPTPSSITGQILRLSTNIAPVLFTNELEYLYTGKGFSDAFEFLFDSSDKRPDADDDDGRIDKLRNDLIYMWRSRLYSDVRVVLTGNFPSGRESYSASDLTTAAFSSHKFILVSRSQYFRDRLQSANFSLPADDNEIKLPSPPFTPASVHFTLGFIYTGTLSFSHRTFDLTTAFHIFRSATYLQLDSLYKEMEARLVEEMMHGLFHAFLPFDQYEKITAGRWGVGGCKCKQCQRRAPRVLEFAMASDVNNAILTRGAQRALSGMFGEGWCSAEFAQLPVKTRSNLVKGVSLRTNSMNVIPLLFAAQTALTKLENNSESWAEDVREMVLTVRKRIDDTMCTNCEEVFEQEEWVAILERDGVTFGDNEKIGWAMDSLLRGLSDKMAPLVYQTVVSAILIRPHPTTGTTLLSPTSVVRAAVERARVDILRWIGRKNRWQFVHAAGGFEELETWAVKEISDEIEVPVDTLLAARSGTGPGKGPTRSGFVSTGPHKIYGDSETASISSFHTTGRGRQPQADQKESNASIHSISKSSITSRNPAARRGPGTSGVSSPPPAPSATSRNQPAARLKPILSSRVQSTVSQAPGPPRGSSVPEAVVSPPVEPQDQSDAASVTSYAKSTPPGSPRSPLPPTTTPTSPLPPSSPGDRPKSVAASVASVRSTASTIRKGNGTLTVPTTHTRPTSQLSSQSDASTAFRTAKSDVRTPPVTSPRSSATKSVSPARDTEPGTRKRTISSTSNISAVSAKSAATAGRTRTVSGGEKMVPSGPKALRPRRGSTASATSTASNRAPKVVNKPTSRKLPTPPGARPPMPTLDPIIKGPQAVARTPSGSSVVAPTKSTLKSALSNASIRSTAPSATGTRRIVSASPQALPRRKGAEENNDEDALPDRTGIEKLVHPATPPEADMELPTPPTAPPAYTSYDPSSPRSLVFPIPPADAKGKAKETAPSLYEDLASRPVSIAHSRSDGGSTVKPSREHADETISLDSRRRNSADTITESSGTITAHNTLRAPRRAPPSIPRIRRGITLNVGIPCIISSKRTRFRAFARYIGEVDGQTGPWVGVEVPVGDSWSGEKLAGRDWNDGSLNGTRYFEISGNHSEWDDGEQRAARRRRIDILLSDKPGILSRKREGDQLLMDRERLKRFRSVSPAMSDTSTSAEVRGLFVRPQQVLYVVDAEH